MRLLITGSGGFLGGAMVRCALAAGHQVRAMQRRPDGLPAGAELCQLDLTDTARLPEAVASVDAVIHCAAVTSAGATDAARSQQVNVEGTRALFLAARSAGVSRWIQISSMSAHPGSTSVYGRTKLGADEVLRGAGPPPAWTILRPSLIYGPGCKGLVAKTLNLLRKLPVLPVLGSGAELIRPIYVDDVAEAALRCLDREPTIAQTYMLGGADELPLVEFMGKLAAGAGLRRPPLRLPLPVCMLLARVLARLTPTPPISVDNVLGVREAQRVENGAAVAALGFTPRGVEVGLRQTFAAESGSHL